MSAHFPGIMHCLFKEIGVYFLLSKELDRKQFVQIVGLLQARTNVALSEEQLDAYWKGIQQRVNGDARWDTISPKVYPHGDLAKERLAFLSENKIHNMVDKRPYMAFSIAGITYLVEMFNPRNELGIHYPNAGEPVLVLLMKEEQYGNVQNNLSRNSEFYSIIQGIDGILNPRLVVGANSSDMALLLKRFDAGKLVSPVRPWDFLFPLSVLRLPKHLGEIALKRYFRKFEP